MQTKNRQPARTKSELTRERILDAAAEVFSRKGYAGTSLSDIASVADLKAGSLYYHFESKDHLVEEVLKESIERAHAHVRTSVDELGADASPRDQLRRAVAAHLEAVLALGPYSPAAVRIVGEIPPHVRQRYFKVQDVYGALWADLFDAARDAGQIRDDLDLLAARLLIIGALNGTSAWPPSLCSDPQGLAETVDKLFFEGMDAR